MAQTFQPDDFDHTFTMEDFLDLGVDTSKPGEEEQVTFNDPFAGEQSPDTQAPDNISPSALNLAPNEPDPTSPK